MANTKKVVSQITWYVSHMEQAKEFSLQNVLYIYVDEEEICKYSPLSALKHSTEFRSEKKPDELNARRSGALLIYMSV